MEDGVRTILPLEEALNIAGSGIYTNYVMIVTGLTLFSAFQGMQVMSIVIPAAGCDLGLTLLQKGLLTSMAFSGMIFSSHLFGFLADTCGRRRVMLVSNALTTAISFLSSLAPNAEFLMLITFINGFVLGGVFTPAYVYVSEFCPQAIRGRGLLVATSLSSMATVYLPCLARLVIPLEIQIPIAGGLVFTSWRLFLALIAIPNIITNILLRQLPETPKYLLNSGKEQETLEILRSIYARNMRKKKSDYPVEGVVLDYFDQLSQSKPTESKQTCMIYMKKIGSQTVAIFTSPFLCYTITSCIIFFGVMGMYNTVALWIPELLKEMMAYSDAHPHYNVTLCQVLSMHHTSPQSSACQINYNIFDTAISIGLLQSAFFCVISIIAPKIKGIILISLLGLVSACASVLLIFAKSFLLTLSCLGTIAILTLGLFPICLSLVVDFYPTSLRSTATSIIMLFGRTGAAACSQIAGVMFHSYCSPMYWVLAIIIIGVIILCIILPQKRK